MKKDKPFPTKCKDKAHLKKAKNGTKAKMLEGISPAYRFKLKGV